MPADPHTIPLGHSIPAHRVHGWCSHCPGRSLAEEVAAWQVDALDRIDDTRPGAPPEHSDRFCPWYRLVADLDRCMYGRHQGDDCGSCGGPSKGNHHLRPGTVIGYGLRGDQIVMPDRDHKHDPAAWRASTPPREEAERG